MRKRPGYIRSVVFFLPPGTKALCRAAAEADGRKVTQWVIQVVRRALQAESVDPRELRTAPSSGERFDLELPGELVDRIALCGGSPIGRYVSVAVLSALADQDVTA